MPAEAIGWRTPKDSVKRVRNILPPYGLFLLRPLPAPKAPDERTKVKGNRTNGNFRSRHRTDILRCLLLVRLLGSDAVERRNFVGWPKARRTDFQTD
jgi:hypothetical protein